jgi:type II secretory pathway pseudopilin PulG
MRLHSQRQTHRPAAAARAEAGFTILETVIALCVALIVGFGAISIFLFASSFNAGASDRARALALAQERMEGWRSKAFADLAATDTTETVTLGGTGPTEADARNFTVDTTVEPDPDVPDDKQFIVTVTVTPVPTGGRFTAKEVMLKMVRGSDEFGDE